MAYCKIHNWHSSYPCLFCDSEAKMGVILEEIVKAKSLAVAKKLAQAALTKEYWKHKVQRIEWEH